MTETGKPDTAEELNTSELDGEPSGDSGESVDVVADEGSDKPVDEELAEDTPDEAPPDDETEQGAEPSPAAEDDDSVSDDDDGTEESDDGDGSDVDTPGHQPSPESSDEEPAEEEVGPQWKEVAHEARERVLELVDEVQGAEKTIEELRSEVAALAKAKAEAEEERDQYKEKMLRAAADLENFKRRSRRNEEEYKRYGIKDVVMELIPAVDNLERALDHVAKQLEAESTAGDESLIDGVKMVYRQILAALEKHGVKGFEALHEDFDPERHEAIQQVESTEFDTGTVVEQFQKGYFLHDRLLRPSLVSVAKRVDPPEEDEGSEEVTPEESSEVEQEHDEGGAPVDASESTD